MVRISQGRGWVGFDPVGAAEVPPELVTRQGHQFVRYQDVWPGVSLVYTVSSDAVKESLVLANARVATRFRFRILEAHLHRAIHRPRRDPAAYKIVGAL